MEIVLGLLFALFVFWLLGRILQKAGFDPLWMLVMVIPVVNVIMVWIFAFADWPNLQKSKREI